MSIALQQNPHKTHDILDDFESLYWSELFCALKHFDGDIAIGLKMFFWYDMADAAQGQRMLGGDQKFSFLTKDEASTLRFKSEPLRSLFQEMSSLWCDYYLAKFRADNNKDNKAYHRKYQQEREKLLEPNLWSDIIDRHLMMPGWVKSDTIPDRYPPKPAKDIEVNVREQIYTALMTTEHLVSQSALAHLDTGNDDSGHANGSSDLAPDSPLSDLPDHDIFSIIPAPVVPTEADDDPFAHDHPGPPPSALVSVGSSGNASRLSSCINTNGKRSLCPEGGENDEELIDASPSPAQAKRSRMDTGGHAESKAESNTRTQRTRTRSVPPGRPRRSQDRPVGFAIQ